MLEEHIAYIQSKQSSAQLPAMVEIILVDDGSKDKTLDYIKQMTAKYQGSLQVVGLRQMVNQGKGAAVKTGVLYSRGDYVLMLDADGATDFNEIVGIYN